MNEFTIEDETLFMKNEIEYKQKIIKYLEDLLTENGVQFNWNRGLSTPRQYSMYIRYLNRLCGRNNISMKKAEGF